MISAGRRIVESEKYTLAGKWKTWEPLGHIGQDLVGRTLGIVGMGRIGYAMASRCHGGWGMRVLYHDQRANEQAERELGAERVAFDKLLAESDFVSVHADLNDTTRGMFNAAAFAKMKPTAVFVNTARGPLVVRSDLAEALTNGHDLRRRAGRDRSRAAAGRQSARWLPNCIVAPHIASATVTSRNAMAEIAADNLIAGLKGEPLRAWVNPEVAANRRKGA